MSFLHVLLSPDSRPYVFCPIPQPNYHPNQKKDFSCNFDDCSSFHLLSSFFDPFRSLDHVCGSHFILCLSISFPADPTIKKSSDTFIFHPYFTVNEFQQAPFSLASCVSRSASHSNPGKYRWNKSKWSAIGRMSVLSKRSCVLCTSTLNF